MAEAFYGDAVGNRYAGAKKDIRLDNHVPTDHRIEAEPDRVRCRHGRTAGQRRAAGPVLEHRLGPGKIGEAVDSDQFGRISFDNDTRMPVAPGSCTVPAAITTRGATIVACP